MGRRRLAEMFGEWMDRNGYTQGDVAAMGGPSTTTQTKVRHTDDALSRRTLRQIDTVMGWAPGGALSVLRGDNPVPVSDPRPEMVRPRDNTGDQLVYARPDGLTDDEWDRIVANVGEYAEWAISRALGGGSSKP